MTERVHHQFAQSIDLIGIGHKILRRKRELMSDTPPRDDDDDDDDPLPSFLFIYVFSTSAQLGGGFHTFFDLATGRSSHTTYDL